MSSRRPTPPPSATVTPSGRSRSKANQAAALRRENAQSYSGDSGDGGVMILDVDGTLLADVPPTVAHRTRDLLARVHTAERGVLPTSIAVTSALSGEGVSFVANALGAVLSHDLDRPICIVDMNWWSPSKTWPKRDHGLADVLRGAVELPAAIAPTVDDQLFLLPAGFATVSERPVLASSADLAKVMVSLRAQFAHIVIDIPAVLPVSESRLLIDHADAFVMVVRHGTTADVQVCAAMEELQHVKNLGVVLNRATARIPARLLHLINPW